MRSSPFSPSGGLITALSSFISSDNNDINLSALKYLRNIIITNTVYLKNNELYDSCTFNCIDSTELTS